MVDYKIKRGTLQGKYFVVFVCDNKDLVTKVSMGIGGYMDAVDRKYKELQDLEDKLKATQEVNKKLIEEDNENV